VLLCVEEWDRTIREKVESSFARKMSLSGGKSPLGFTLIEDKISNAFEFFPLCFVSEKTNLFMVKILNDDRLYSLLIVHFMGCF